MRNCKHTVWFEKISELQPFEWVGGNVLNVVFVSSFVVGVKSLFIGLFVNGSRSYNLNMEFLSKSYIQLN